MKKTIIFFTLILMVFGCSEDFLERYPSTSMVIENFYKTPEDGTQAVTSIYNMASRDDWWSYYILAEQASDNCAGGGGTGDGGGYQRVDRGIQWPDANAHQEPWLIYYGGVYRANIYLEYESLIDWTGKESLQLQYQSEARFMRAYYHFYLARMFGEIPTFDHPATPNEIPPRTPHEELYTFLLDDLKFCIENGLSAPYGSMQSANWGRATKWAAEAMFARVYLYYSGYYNDATCGEYTAADAQNYIDDVIDNSGHDLVSSFASLWRVSTISELGDNSLYAGEVNPEVVWSIRYEPSGNLFQWLSRMIGPRGTNQDPYGQGWGAIPVLPSLWNAYDNADTRKTATILSWDGEGRVYDWVGQAQAQYTGYNSKKYELVSAGNIPEASSWQSDGSEDFMVIRFSDVLLMGAELHLASGDNGNALTLTNRVRERAFGDNTHNYTAVTVDDILNERRLEFACEGSRFSDILRSCKGDFSKLGTLLTYVDEADSGDFASTVDVYSLDVDGNNFVETKGLFQIPQIELDLMNGIIEQNPGFE